MPEAKWHIRIERIEGTAVPPRYRVAVDYGLGFNEKFHVFKADLPPSFADLVEVAAATAAPADAGPAKRGAWRFKSGEVPPDMLAYHAGDLATLQQIGSRLYQSIFTNPETGNDFTDVLDRDRATSGVRIALEVPPDLARVPWEAMLPPGRDTFLATTIDSNIVRLASAEVEGDPPRPADLPLRLLVAVANPDRDLATGAELADIQRRVAALEKGANPQIKLEQPLLVTTRASFEEAIFATKPHIVHFIGHGDFRGGEGLIYFHDEDDHGKADPIGSDDLRSFFENDKPWLVVLNSCLGARASVVDPFGGAAHNLIRINIPFVVAMQYPISDDAAIAFSRMLYAALARGARVPDAVTRARMAIRKVKDEGIKPELITPVLYVPRHSLLDTIALVPPAVAIPPAPIASPPAAIAPTPQLPPEPVTPAAAAPPKSRSRRTLALLTLLGVPALALLALLLWSPWSGLQSPGPAPSAKMESSSSSGALSGGGAPPLEPADTAGSVIGDSRPVSAGPTRDRIPIMAEADGTGIGYGSGGEGATASPRPRPPSGGRAPGGSGSGAGEGSADYASAGEEIALSGWAGRRPLRVFVGGAASLRDGDPGVALGATLGARTGAWSHRLQAAADLTPRKGPDRARIAADYTVERRLGDSGLRLTGELAYARNDRTSLRRRFVESAGMRWAGDGLALTVAAAAAQTRFARGDRGVDTRRSAIGGLARIEAFTDLGDAISLEARAQILAAGPLTATAGAKVSYRLSNRTALIVSADLDHERDTPTRHRTSVIARAGVAIAF